jgi:flavin reductase (DIM6/NTAB) family NADH-FMN oxidoreductase RutF
VEEIVVRKNKVKFSYPPLVTPLSLVGANVGGKPNFEAISWFNLVDYQPNLVSISSEKSHYTNKGTRENKTFSVNIPSVDMAEATDFCGLNSGSKVDKSKVFDVFYGELKTVQ